MRLTLIRDDNLVTIDGRAITVDLSDMPADLHAVQWSGDAGHIERQGWMNQPIDSLDDFQLWIERWNTAAFAADNPPAPAFSDVKMAFITKVDADADAIYASALGNRETEYKQAEAEASAFRSAGYGGDVPSYVQAWASAKGASAQWAADDILATASAWRAAQAMIRTNRLACKEAARSATTTEELALVVAQWEAFVVAITEQLRTP